MTKMSKIVELLPEGLTEDTVNQIAELVNETIVEAVAAKTEDLNTKVVSFIRMNMEELKEQALKELELENEIYRNAKIAESIKEFLVTEFVDTDEENAISTEIHMREQSEKENEVLVDELDKVLGENTKLANVVKALGEKVSILEGLKESLTESKSKLAEDLKKREEDVEPFKSSEKALVVSENTEIPQKIDVKNDFLNEENMRFMPNGN